MAKVSMQLAHGELISPFGLRASLPIGSECHRHVDECYWMARVNGVTVKWDDEAEQARAEELERLETEHILRPLPPLPRDSNGTISSADGEIHDYPVVIVNPRGLFDAFDGGVRDVKVEIPEDQLKRIVTEILTEAGVLPTTRNQSKKISVPHAPKEDKAFEV